MIQVISAWFTRYFSDPQAVLLAMLLILGFAVVILMGDMLMPVLASAVIAYLLEAMVQALASKIPRLVAVMLVFSGFVAVLLFILIILLPLLSHQLTQFIQEWPKWAIGARDLLIHLPEKYPDFISMEQIEEIIDSINQNINRLGQNMLSYSLASIPALITFLVYMILVPLLVFFFLKDKQLLLDWFEGFLPQRRHVAKLVWKEMDRQMGNYVRGKVYEVFIVGAASYAAFTVMGLNYAPLLAALVGLSVIIPYLGAVVVTLPVALVAFFQWGVTSDFFWLIAVYGIIQALDGNVLVPLLFSEAVNLHPVAIITAVLVFGGLWGFWGVFFAIPLATLVKALLISWPRTENKTEAVVA